MNLPIFGHFAGAKQCGQPGGGPPVPVAYLAHLTGGLKPGESLVANDLIGTQPDTLFVSSAVATFWSGRYYDLSDNPEGLYYLPARTTPLLDLAGKRITFWIKTPKYMDSGYSTTQYGVLGDYAAGTGFMIELRMIGTGQGTAVVATTGAGEAMVSNVNIGPSTGGANNEQWHFVDMLVDTAGNGGYIKVDGIDTTASNTIGTITNNPGTNLFGVGKTPESSHEHSGYLKDLRIINANDSVHAAWAFRGTFLETDLEVDTSGNGRDLWYYGQGTGVPSGAQSDGAPVDIELAGYGRQPLKIVVSGITGALSWMNDVYTLALIEGVVFHYYQHPVVGDAYIHYNYSNDTYWLMAVRGFAKKTLAATMAAEGFKYLPREGAMTIYTGSNNAGLTDMPVLTYDYSSYEPVPAMADGLTDINGLPLYGKNVFLSELLSEASVAFPTDWPVVAAAPLVPDGSFTQGIGEWAAGSPAPHSITWYGSNSLLFGSAGISTVGRVVCAATQIVAGKKYLLKLRIVSNGNTNSAAVEVGAQTILSMPANVSNRDYVVYFTATQSGPLVLMQSGYSPSTNVDNISLTQCVTYAEMLALAQAAADADEVRFSYDNENNIVDCIYNSPPLDEWNLNLMNQLLESRHD